MTPANNREALLWQVQMTSFAVDEARLYLDTHPCDATALAQYGQMRDMRLNAVNAYNAPFILRKSSSIMLSSSCG